AGLDPVRQLLVVAAVVPDLAREGDLQPGEERLVALLAAAQGDQPDVAVEEELGQGVEQQIEPLLRGEARDQADHRSARRRRAADLVEQRLDRKSTRLNSSHVKISYAVFCLK